MANHHWYQLTLSLNTYLIRHNIVKWEKFLPSFDFLTIFKTSVPGLHGSSNTITHKHYLLGKPSKLEHGIFLGKNLKRGGW